MNNQIISNLQYNKRMKTIYKIQSILLAILLFGMIGCQDDISQVGDLEAPKNLTVSAAISPDGSGMVNFDANADGAIIYHFFLGLSDTENAVISGDGNLQAIYRSSGDYTVKVIAYGPGGIATNTTTDITVDVIYEAPTDLIQILTGGSSRDWEWEKEVPAHLGVGPNNGDDGLPLGEPIWYTSQPFEKESVGCLYEDILTFSLDGNNVNYQLKSNAVTYFNAGEVQSALGSGDPNEDACYDFPEIGEVTLGFFAAETGLANSTGVGFLLGNNSFMSYYVGSSQYEIMAYTDDVIYVRTVQVNDDGLELAWYQRFRATDAVTTNPEIEYELVWEDDFLFNGPPSSSRWSFDIGTGENGWGNGESQYYTDRSDNVFIANGILNIIAKRENFSGSQFTSTRMKTQDKFEFTYGKVEIKAKLPNGKGTWPALWMLGANFPEVGWPTCGELDIMEHVGNNQNVIQSAIHTPSSFGDTFNKGSLTVPGVSEEFHVYEMEWTEDFVSFSVDGSTYYTYQPDVQNGDTWPFDSDQFLIFNVAMGGALGGEIEAAFTESSMQIDYVKVYQEVE